MTLFKQSLIAVTISLTLAACGGSDDSKDNPKPEEPPVLQPLPTETVDVEIGDSTITALKESHVITHENGEQSLSAVESFKGIEFATAERFEHSVVAELDTEVNATEFGFACPQLKTTSQTQSEDCLNLNIWRPADINADEVLPVYVFIHGGDFEYGANSEPLIHGDTVVAQGAVEGNPFIAVTVNYRLGLLGSYWQDEGGEEGKGGNYGLGDQKRALEWVNQNIDKFGGDITNVTLMGQGAGAMSVGILQQEASQEPIAGEFFTRAIMQSNPYGFDYRTNSQAKSFASQIEDTQAEMPELSELDIADMPVEQLMKLQAEVNSPLNRVMNWLTSSINFLSSSTPMPNLMPFAPYIEQTKDIWGRVDIEGYHLAEQPALNHFTVPTVVGVNSEESNTIAMLPKLTFLIAGLLPEPEEGEEITPEAIIEWLSHEENQALAKQKLASMSADEINAQIELGDILPSTAYEAITMLFFGLGNGELTSGILGLADYYPNPEGELSGGLDNMGQFKMMLNDTLFSGPARIQAREAQAENIEASFYHFGYHASFNVWTYNTEGQESSVDIGDVIKSVSCISGACNGSELPFVFNKALKLDGTAVSQSSKDQALMDKMSRLWFSDALFEDYQYTADSDAVLVIDNDGNISSTPDWDSSTQQGVDPALRQGRLTGLENLDLIGSYLK
ncbi:carboxylesterase family protein [Shewanella olleyana]|uniref:carboxylesterase family protein n=1 Tax=Shewanella olleyana TaxID=135626 RepID=UPI00200E8B3E|nr:carboxylesterase family protein [Shewanella olleyana]MCL1065782.1 carboxylesterase family protein [Shewanella olleyana]